MLGMETGAFVFFVITLVVGVLGFVLGQIKDKTATTVDDKIYEYVLEAKALLDRWNDPADPAVPPSPTNPEGKA